MKKFLLKVKKAVSFLCVSLILTSNVFAGKVPDCTPGLSTIKNFLATAMQPVGETLYIWGGGHDCKAAPVCKAARHIGVWPQWKEFFNSQDQNYDFRNYAICKDGKVVDSNPTCLSLGLDCSGYRGWVLYNVFHSKNMESIGYVVYSGNTECFINNNWGTSINPKDIKSFKAGDVMAKQGHTYIVIGQCSDGSIVLVHSSRCGVHICGTVTPDGNERSKAVALAESYMKKYYTEYDKRYSRYGYMRDGDYLTQYTQLRWDTKGVMKDPDHYTEMNAEQVLKSLFGE